MVIRRKGGRKPVEKQMASYKKGINANDITSYETVTFAV